MQLVLTQAEKVPVWKDKGMIPYHGMLARTLYHLLGRVCTENFRKYHPDQKRIFW
jgi:hypothetical protein